MATYLVCYQMTETSYPQIVTLATREEAVKMAAEYREMGAFYVNFTY